MDILVRLTAAIVILVTFPIVSLAQLSPGDLAEAHESIEGLTNCTQCHELGEGPSGDKCLACHKLLKSQIEMRQGFHHFALNAGDKTCFECHSDHAGRDFELINWPMGISNFNHTQTGYVLSGKHATIQCRDCHNPAKIKDDLKKIEKDIDLTRTFLGLKTECKNCHSDKHRGQLGSDCQNCHLSTSWKPTENFNHDASQFKLIGMHIKVTCKKCHPTVSESTEVANVPSAYVKYKNLKFGNCLDCHKDVHENRFGTACEKCHTPNGWRQLVSSDFDHNLTRFRLKGRHIDLKCEKCHKSAVKMDRMKFEQCQFCHEDRHNGQFANRPDGGLCESCHNEDRFIPALYTMDDHSKSNFPLKGAHLAQPCTVCHKILEPNPDMELSLLTEAKPYRLFKLTATECHDCHNDPHAGQFANSDPVKLCQDCHSDQDWRDLQFDHNKNCSYPLEGAHKKVECQLCHKSEQSGDLIFARYRPIAKNCRDCHSGALKEL